MMMVSTCQTSANDAVLRLHVTSLQETDLCKDTSLLYGWNFLMHTYTCISGTFQCFTTCLSLRVSDYKEDR